jgi:hypothetical protein
LLSPELGGAKAEKNQMTRTEILREYGITDGKDVRVQGVQETGAKGKGELWLVGIKAIGNPVTAISAKKAVELVVRLRQIGENSLADDISTAAWKVQEANQASPA